MILTSCGDDDEDECVQITWYEDADGDGLGNPDVSQTACEQPAGFVDNSSDTEDCTTSTFYQDADGDGLGNPDVSQEACTQPEGFVDNADDTEDCVTMTFYEDQDGDGLGNPDVTQEACEQPEGFVDNADDDNDLPVEPIILFESAIEALTDTPEDWETVFDAANGRFGSWASLNGGVDDGVTAQVGNNYVTVTQSLADEDRTARIQFVRSGDDDVALDISAFSDPHINVWLHSGSSPLNVMSFEMDVRDSVVQAERELFTEQNGDVGDDVVTAEVGSSTFFSYEQDNDETEPYESLINNGITESNTGGEWKLYSIPLNSAIWLPNGDPALGKKSIFDDSDVKIVKIERIRFEFSLNADQFPDRSGQFVCHFDEISITEGPLASN
ncbi:MAG: hypothetical protein AAGC88_07915 [Bacteroidota bacterium]